MENESDPTLYRVTLICACNNDLAYAYGATIEQARMKAVAFFRKDHGKRARWREEIVEHAVPNDGRSMTSGSHYVECVS